MTDEHAGDYRAWCAMMAAQSRTCRGCGCSEFRACITDHGPCAWVLLDLETPTGVCSGCAVEVAFHPLELMHMGFEEPPRDEIERRFGT